MTDWPIRSPSIFPTYFADSVILAYETGEPVSMLAARSKPELVALANKIREWRFCLRNAGSLNSRAYEIETTMRIKLKLQESHGIWNLWLSVHPRTTSGLIDRNPALQGLV